MRGGGVAVHTDYANQPRTAYFCQEGMFVLLMIRFPSRQITVPYIHIYTIPPRLKSLRAPCLSQFFFLAPFHHVFEIRSSTEPTCKQGADRNLAAVASNVQDRMI